MPDIEVNCGSCGAVFDVSEDLGGLITQCPSCNRQISVPLPAEQVVKAMESPSRLQVKRDETVTGGKRCPGCGSAMQPEAVLCIYCGYDLRTGKPINTPTPMSPIWRVVAWGLGAILVALGLKIVLGRFGTANHAASPPSVATTVVSTASAPAAAPVAPAAAMARSNAAVAQAASTGQTAAVTLNPAEVARREQELRQEYRRRLNEKYPLFERGASIVLYRANGMVHRGMLVDLKPDAVVLYTQSQRIDIPFKTLKQESRVQCDAKFRDQLIEAQVQKKMREPTGAKP